MESCSDNQHTTLAQFSRLYRARTSEAAYVTTSDLAEMAEVAELLTYPLFVLERSTPGRLPRTRVALAMCLQKWASQLADDHRAQIDRSLAHLVGTASGRWQSEAGRDVDPIGQWLIRPQSTRRRRPSESHWFWWPGHCLSYWNSSPNGGLRRW